MREHAEGAFEKVAGRRARGVAQASPEETRDRAERCDRESPDRIADLANGLASLIPRGWRGREHGSYEGALKFRKAHADRDRSRDVRRR